MFSPFLKLEGTDSLRMFAWFGLFLLRIRQDKRPSIPEGFNHVAGIVEADIRDGTIAKVTSLFGSDKSDHPLVTLESVRKELLLRFFALEGIRLLQDEVSEGRMLEVPMFRPGVEQFNEESITALWAILHRFGWPKPDEFGPTACEVAWRIAYESGEQLQDFQYYFGSSVSPAQRAMARDRITLEKFDWQDFGTQVQEKPKGSDGSVIVIVPGLKDPAGVDSRRSQVGLKSLKEAVALYSDAPRKVVSLPQGYPG